LLCPDKDSSVFLPLLKMFRTRNMTLKATQVGAIIEYDDEGAVVWSRKASKYFDSANIEQHGCKSDREKRCKDVYENAFLFDKGSRSIYPSFKNPDLIPPGWQGAPGIRPEIRSRRTVPSQ
jgi:hypothetical protein